MSRLTTSHSLVRSDFSGSNAGIAHPQLPKWVFALPGVSTAIERLGATEIRRRLFHMSPALLPVGLPFIPHQDVWGPTLICIVALIFIVGLTLAVNFGSLMKRDGEKTWMYAVVGYMVSVLAPLILFPGRAEFALMTLQIIALGDGSATLGGLMIRGPRLPWNQKKTFSGMFCFGIVGSLAATYSYWGEARPGVPVAAAWLICTVAAFCAAVVESLPIRSNDNFRVGMTALFVGMAMTAVIL